MTQEQFKEILESIEVGLYDRWERNFKADKDNFGLNVKKSIEETYCDALIGCKFIWEETNPITQGQVFWENVNKRYKEILKERGLI